MADIKSEQVRLTEAEQNAIYTALCDCGDPECLVRMDYQPSVLWPAIERIVAARVAEAVESAVTAIEEALIECAPRVGAELRHDGIEEPGMAAYVEGWHDAWGVLDQIKPSLLRKVAEDTGG